MKSRWENCSEIRASAAALLQKLEPGELAVAAVQDRMRQEEQGPRELVGGRGGEEERGAGEADRDAHERHDVGSHGGGDQASGDGERDSALEVARGDPFAALDEAPEQPRLRAGKVGARGE